MRRAQVEKTRKERKAREAFRDLLQSLVKSGQMKARTKWKDVYPSFSDDIRYLDMLGNPGSNPLELFWDLVDNLDQQLDAKIAVAEGAIKRHNKKLEAQQEKQVPEGKEMNLFKVSPETSEEEFLAVIQGNEDEDVRKLSMQDLQEIYHTLHSQAMKQQADERRRAERRQRHLQDDLRYALRKLSEPIDLSMSYEEAVPLMQDLPEYKAIEDEEGRKAAFSKYIKRQRASRLREREREASEDGGSTTSRKRKEVPKDAREPERERDRDRDHRERERDVEKDAHHDRASRSHRGHDEYDAHPASRTSRDYARERDYSRDKAHHPREKERDYTRRDRRSSKGDFEFLPPRDWVEGPPPFDVHDGPPARERSASIYREEPPRDKRDRSVYEDRVFDERAEKEPPPRAETPEEGEI
ncbi:hypothetical protein IEO21_01348 [Rhodonia placenta]|nr:hypothetical protein IEO21_01348 [Postia placenta]